MQSKTIKIIISIILSLVALFIIYIFSLNSSGSEPVKYVCDLEREKDCFSAPRIETYSISDRKIATKYSPCCSEDLSLYEIKKYRLFELGGFIRVNEEDFNKMIKIYKTRYGDKLEFKIDN